MFSAIRFPNISFVRRLQVNFESECILQSHSGGLCLKSSPQRTLLNVILRWFITWWMDVYVTTCQWCMPCYTTAVFLLSSTWIIGSELSQLITCLWCGAGFLWEKWVDLVRTPFMPNSAAVPCFHSPLTNAKPNRQDKLIRGAPRLAAFAPSASTAKTQSPSGGKSGAFWDNLLQV